MRTLLRTRWAAIGAAVAVTLGVGGVGFVGATVSDGDRDVFVSMEPCRLMDTRPEFLVGNRTTPIGPGETYEVETHGAHGDCVIDTDASGLVLNVTSLNASAPTNVRFFPADATLPTVSHLNPVPGDAPAPNAVTTRLSGDGEFAVYNSFGTVDLIIDVAGYYEHHDHDDRYLPRGEIVTTHAAGAWVATDIPDAPAAFSVLPAQVKVDGAGRVLMPLTAPVVFAPTGGGPGSLPLGATDVTYCLDSVGGGGYVTSASVVARARAGAPDILITDDADRSASGCYTLLIPGAAPTGAAYELQIVTAGGGYVFLGPVDAGWAPVPA